MVSTSVERLERGFWKDGIAWFGILDGMVAWFSYLVPDWAWCVRYLVDYQYWVWTLFLTKRGSCY